VVDLFGNIDESARSLPEKVAIAIAWIREYEPEALRIDPLGYYVAISGGKDSECLKRLFQLASVRCEFWYNNVTIDPPELIRHLKQHHADVQWNNPKKHLINMMAESKTCGPPTRLLRWCCEIYKEQGGNGRFKAIGVRAAESPRRKANWAFLSSDRRTDTPIICPIIHWTDADVWQFIREQQIPYCSLYDEGFKRLGCIGCPMGGPIGQARDFARWPKYEAMWKRGFQRYFDKYKGVPKLRGGPRAIEKFPTVDDLWQWWVSGKAYEGNAPDCQSWLW